MKKVIKNIIKLNNRVDIADYLRDYVTPDIFLEECKKCDHYGKLWSCPPFSFDPVAYWENYDTLELLASKIIFTEEALSKTYTETEISEILHSVAEEEKIKLTEELYSMENENSRALSGGCCTICESCTRPDNMPCRYPDKMRYSIEALGGNVGLTCTRLLHENLQWIEEGKLPSHMIIVCGLLKKAR